MNSGIQGNYKLVIAEKPDAARRIAASLGRFFLREIQGIEIFDVPLAFDKDHYVVCSASGHLYGIADPSRKRRIYPVFDTEWFPSEKLLLGRKMPGAKNFPSKYSKSVNRMKIRLALISDLVSNANQIVHACDYDVEGETIGYNIIRYACRNELFKKPVLRAKFSTLMEKDVRDSFSNMGEIDLSIAQAGRARHLVDYIWGINLSRALSEAHRAIVGRFRNITIGRVQGPTLAFVVDSDIKAKTHVPLPYWNLHATLQKENIEFDALYEKNKIEVKREADEIYAEIKDLKSAGVSGLREYTFREHPPYPFNLGDLQREVFKLYKFSPSLTMSIAEKLYLRALISYPRTSSQKLPPSIGYSKIIDQILRQREYSKYAFQMQEGRRRSAPFEGNKDDPAHPAIYPTGSPSTSLNTGEKKIYDLIVLRFLACFADDAMLSKTTAKLLIANFPFVATGQSSIKEGWMSIYPSHFSDYSAPLPSLQEGEDVQIVKTDLESLLSGPPPLFNQGSLLRKMESTNIGTKATRAGTLSTLINRGYVLQDRTGSLMPTEIGLSLVESLEMECPAIVSTELTRKTEEELEKIIGEKEKTVVVLAKVFQDVHSVLGQIHRSQKKIGYRLQVADVERDHATQSLYKSDRRNKEIFVGKCPLCHQGRLKVIRSQRTHKRFLGCTNYSKGCRASAPLPQRGIVRKHPHECKMCGWPMIGIKFSLRSKGSWNICPNPGCASKQSKKKQEIEI